MTDRQSAMQREILQRRPFASKREECFLALLRTAAVVKRPVAKLVEERGISLAQYNVLRILRGAGEAGLPTLAVRERMVEEAAGITRLIDKLEGSGLVRRDRTASADRRRVICYVTDAGLRLLDELDGGVLAAVDGTLAMLDDERVAEAIVLLDEIRASGRMEPAALLSGAGGGRRRGT